MPPLVNVDVKSPHAPDPSFLNLVSVAKYDFLLVELYTILPSSAAENTGKEVSFCSRNFPTIVMLWNFIGLSF